MIKKASKYDAFGVFGRIKLIRSWIKLLADFVKMVAYTGSSTIFEQSFVIFGTKMLTRLVLI
jgi:hypothetical protein